MNHFVFKVLFRIFLTLNISSIVYAKDVQKISKNSQNLKYNYQKNIDLYRQAAEQSYLGLIYENGHGVEKDLNKAKEYYKLSCNNGFQLGCNEYKKFN